MDIILMLLVVIAYMFFMTFWVGCAFKDCRAKKAWSFGLDITMAIVLLLLMIKKFFF